MKIELCGECASRLVAEDLLDLYQSEASMRNMFSRDEAQNTKEVKKFRKALKTVIEYYGGDVHDIRN